MFFYTHEVSHIFSVYRTRNFKLGGELGLGYILFNVYLCNHILLQSGGGTWDTGLYTVRGVSSESRDVDTCRSNVSVHRGSGNPSTDVPGE
jgi:hypothetical protein